MVRMADVIGARVQRNTNGSAFVYCRACGMFVAGVPACTPRVPLATGITLVPRYKRHEGEHDLYIEARHAPRRDRVIPEGLHYKTAPDGLSSFTPAIVFIVDGVRRAGLFIPFERLPIRVKCFNCDTFNEVFALAY